MNGTLKSLLLAATLFRFTLGDEPQSWRNMPVNPPPSTVTTTVYSEKTVYVSVTTEKTIPTTVTTTVYQAQPTTITTTVYEVKPTTITTTIFEAKPTTVTTTVYQAAPTTVTAIRTEPVTVHVTTTIYATVVNSQTFINTVTSVDTKYQTNTATQVQYTTVTVINTVPTTIIAPCTTSTRSLTGLVLCPSRIVNPTYTPATPLPSNYLWGCAPGYICQPKQENCNFEQNLPAKSYICSPDQCKKAKPLPSLEEIKALVNRGPTCAWLTPVEGYFNLDPRPWGLTYAIFNIFGQPTCPALPPPSSSSTTTASWATWSPPPPPPSSTNWGTWSESTTPSQTPSRSSSPTAWQDWSGWSSPSAVASHSGPWSSKVTARAILQKRDEYYPAGCYQFCNYALEVWQSVGNEAAQLCPQNGRFSSALSALTSCSSVSGTAGAPLIGITSLEDAKAVCNRSPSTTQLLKPREVSSSATATFIQEAAETMSILSAPSSTATGAAQTSSMRAAAAARPSSELSGFMTMLFSFLAVFLNI